MTEMILAGVIALVSTLIMVAIVDYILKQKEKWDSEYKNLDWYDNQDD